MNDYLTDNSPLWSSTFPLSKFAFKFFQDKSWLHFFNTTTASSMSVMTTTRINIYQMFLWSFSCRMFSGLGCDILWTFLWTCLWNVSGVFSGLGGRYFAYVILQRERSFLWTSECSLEESIEINQAKTMHEYVAYCTYLLQTIAPYNNVPASTCFPPGQPVQIANLASLCCSSTHVLIRTPHNTWYII
jgi:hypothetical protein